MATKTPAERVARRVRAELAGAGLTQQALAEHLEVSQAAVSRRLTGATPFDVNEIAAVAQFLELPVTALIGDAA